VDFNFLASYVLAFDLQGTIARGNDIGPSKIIDTMAFMFESSLIPRISQWALESPFLDHDYYQCWIGLRSHFTVTETCPENPSVRNGE